ncbi:MAG TPA: hypothetical protein VIH75_20540 [Candidatus Sulfotelmatobacter sp.]
MPHLTSDLAWMRVTVVIMPAIIPRPGIRKDGDASTANEQRFALLVRSSA